MENNITPEIEATIERIKLAKNTVIAASEAVSKARTKFNQMAKEFDEAYQELGRAKQALITLVSGDADEEFSLWRIGKQ